MTKRSITESVVAQATLAWLESVGWSVQHGVEIALGELTAERSDYGQVVMEQRLNASNKKLWYPWYAVGLKPLA